MKCRRDSAATTMLIPLIALISVIYVAAPSSVVHAGSGGTAVVGNGTAASCNGIAVRDALATRPALLTFNCGPAHAVIGLVESIVVHGDLINSPSNSPLRITGGSQVTLLAPAEQPAVSLYPGASLTVEWTRFSGTGRDCVVDTMNGHGTVVLRGVTIGDSASTAVCLGQGSNLTLADSTITRTSGSYGAAVYATDSAVSIVHSSIRDNSPAAFGTAGGGGLAMYGGTATVERSYIGGNIVGGAADTISKGGGIYSSGTLTVIASTIASNTAGRGAAIFAEGPNSALLNLTIMSNVSRGSTSGALSAAGPGSMFNTLLAYNAPANCGPERTFTSMSNNQETAASCAWSSTAGVSNVDPRLGLLSSTEPYALPLGGSSLIDAGNPTACTHADQRGVLFGNNVFRNVDGDLNGSAICDVGAVEFIPGDYVPMPSRRLLDSRPNGVTADGLYRNFGPLTAGLSTRFHVAGRAGLPPSPYGVMAQVTAVGATQNGYVTIYPCNPRGIVPRTTTLTFRAGAAVGVATMLRADTEMCAFVSADTHLIVDVVGVIPNAAFRLGAYGRFLDTRSGPTIETVDGQYVGIGMRAAGTQTRVVLGGRASVPAGVWRAVVSVTTVGATAGGYAVVYSCDSPPPTAATVTYRAGVVATATALVEADATGGICISNSSPTHLIVDVIGYTVAPSDTLSVQPKRMLDTRIGPQFETIDGVDLGAGLRPADTTTVLHTIGRAGIPFPTKVLLINVTSVGSLTNGFVSVYACGKGRPPTSSLNFEAGFAVTGLIAVEYGDVDICVYSSASTHLVVDLVGYGIDKWMMYAS